jgi:hypothetical protein
MPLFPFSVDLYQIEAAFVAPDFIMMAVGYISVPGIALRAVPFIGDLIFARLD